MADTKIIVRIKEMPHIGTTLHIQHTEGLDIKDLSYYLNLAILALDEQARAPKRERHLKLVKSQKYC